MSSVIIISGAVLCVLGTPPADGCSGEGNASQLSASDFMELFLRPLGLSWFLVLVVAVLASVVAILWYERRYPFSPDASASEGSTPGGRSGTPGKLKESQSANDVSDVESVSGGSVINATPAIQAFADAEESDAGSVSRSSVDGEKQGWLHRTMALVYPASLGLDEGVADLLIKGWTAMLTVCTSTGEGCASAALWVSVVVWTVSAFASAFWWMPRVFRRYEVTVALPIEYGALNAANVCTGLLFYAEHESMTDRQLALVVGGLAVILSGIAVGQLRLGR